MEIWKDIPGYEGLYQITLSGKVRSLNYWGKKDKIHEIKPGLYAGYLKLNLSKEGKRKHFGIHLLLAMTFMGHVPCGMDLIVDHINNNPLDNRLENLQIITQRENSSKDKKRNLPTGVIRTPNSKKNPYQSLIKIKGKITRLGCFPTQEQASAAYQKALLTLAQPNV